MYFIPPCLNFLIPFQVGIQVQKLETATLGPGGKTNKIPSILDFTVKAGTSNSLTTNTANRSPQPSASHVLSKSETLTHKTPEKCQDSLSGDNCARVLNSSTTDASPRRRQLFKNQQSVDTTNLREVPQNQTSCIQNTSRGTKSPLLDASADCENFGNKENLEIRMTETMCVSPSRGRTIPHPPDDKANYFSSLQQ